MTDLLSLGPVLDLIERWQRDMDDGVALSELDIPALRALAEQHAAQLRARAEVLDEFGHDAFTVYVAEAAADFLAAPRREPEAE